MFTNTSNKNHFLFLFSHDSLSLSSNDLNLVVFEIVPRNYGHEREGRGKKNKVEE